MWLDAGRATAVEACSQQADARRDGALVAEALTFADEAAEGSQVIARRFGAMTCRAANSRWRRTGWARDVNAAGYIREAAIARAACRSVAGCGCSGAVTVHLREAPAEGVRMESG